MQICYNEECQFYNEKIVDNCANVTLCNVADECENYLIAKKEPVLNFLCSDGLSLPCSLADDLMEHCLRVTKEFETIIHYAKDRTEKFQHLVDKSSAALKQLEDIIEAR